ncbi:hydantoinase/oxoprolinase family protein [Roseiarcaceae bacterium H3SJ34-1]|uniref:hydantoinase/oxoprolinase family protein n=1 Tax=Terripilifer ovatus TaxID=3032367 RepID=UPI003AB98F35|nr:hydantoinase/oxoprolinase family protein [Roseiarcaceae bacterium H3SJ34-1]
MALLIAADTGGTFTDLAAYDTATRRVTFSKSLTTYGNLVDGVMDCVRKTELDLGDAEILKFGTTLVINTYVQRSGARTALVATRGFRDILELRRGNRPIPFDVRYKPDAPLVDRDLRLEVTERMGADGAAVTSLDEADVEKIAQVLRDEKVEAVAVSLLNAYVNDAHERRAVEMLRNLLPGVYVTSGTELSPEWYEYERTSTAAANAYVGPRLHTYIDRLDMAVRERGFAKKMFLMASNGGVFSVERARQQPVMLVESGPVGGCIGAGVYARELGVKKAVAFDMGGTTAKCALLDDGQFEVKSPYYVGGTTQGFPVRGGVLDIVEIGTGGGSIAYADPHGRLCVGPRSAGSTPGPACYGLGGNEPTMTDANLILGRIGRNSFLGGTMSLNVKAAEDAMARLAATVGIKGPQSLERMALGVLTLGTLAMAQAIRQITVERGLDPREFLLVAFGGGGPLHSVEIASELGIPEILIPPEPGVFAAVGMILADARIDRTQTFLRALDAEAAMAMKAMFARMEEEMRHALNADLPAAKLSFERRAEMRFRGQRHTLLTPLGEAENIAEIAGAFEASYRRRFGRFDEKAPIEFVGLSLTAFAAMGRPPLGDLCQTGQSGAIPATTTRKVYFADGGWNETEVYQRATLPRGFKASGPAVIEEFGSSTVIGPKHSFAIGEIGEIRVHLGNESERS